MPKVSNLKIALQTGTANTVYATWSFSENTSSGSATNAKPKVGDTVTIKSGSKYYNGASIPSFVMQRQWIVYQISGDRAVINKSTDGAYAIMSAINVNNLTVAKSTTTYTTSNTVDKYRVQWYYDSGNGVWFKGSEEDTQDKYSTYSFPSNAIHVRVGVTPIAKTYKQNDKDVPYWTGTRSEADFHPANQVPPDKLSAPTVTLDKFTLTAKIENIEDSKADQVQFEVYNGDKKYKSSTVSVVTARAVFTTTVAAGGKYRVRCRAINVVGSSKIYGEWSPYSSEENTIPTVPTNVKCSVESETSIRVSWTGTDLATSYTVEYATKKEYFDSSSDVKSVSVTNAYAYITGLDTGEEWYFRVKAVNGEGESGWSDIVYKILGTKPSPPTTWSLTSTAVIGEGAILYWVHNSEDGSKQTQAQIELTINSEATIKTINTPQDSDDDEEEKIYSYEVDMTSYPEGAEVLWRVRTRGITYEYSDWSVQRTIKIYAPPVASLTVGELLTSFPFNISVTAAPDTQKAITYHVSILAEDTYESIDDIGNTITVNAGTEVFSRVFNVMGNSFSYDLMPEDITLANNQSYRINIVVSMDSGLTAEASDIFGVVWEDVDYEPDASVVIDTETWSAQIIPFAINSDNVLIEDVVLAVYRREFDGSFVEIASGITNDGATTVVDPHPSLDYARYRIVARNTNTSVCGFSDLPGQPVGGPYSIIQWDEEWSEFDYAGDTEPVIQPWTGSMLILPYNFDVSEKYDPDVSLIEYIGRKHPVSYYGTQKGSSQTWTTEVPKTDTETIYALRRLSVWSGDVYVRESSGNGFWANVKVSMNLKHSSLVVPVTLDITRVEGDSP